MTPDLAKPLIIAAVPVPGRPSALLIDGPDRALASQARALARVFPGSFRGPRREPLSRYEKSCERRQS